jgi:hypothetical protein
MYTSNALRSCLLYRASMICFADLDWESKTVDEDVHQAENTCLPAGLIVHVAHSHEGAEEVLGADVGAYLACGDGPVQ